MVASIGTSNHRWGQLREDVIATGNITKRAVDALLPRSSPQFLWETEVKGFGLKVVPSGARSYVCQYRLGGRKSKVRRHTIGAHGRWAKCSAPGSQALAQLVDHGKAPSALDPADAARTTRVLTILLAEEY